MAGGPVMPSPGAAGPSAHLMVWNRSSGRFSLEKAEKVWDKTTPNRESWACKQ